ncbi:MAG: PQQ-binding-like beta-propeller repeat protein [Candidatus Sumerlaeia bacterium]
MALRRRSCYAGSRIIGFFTLSAKLPVGLDGALGLEAPERLTKGPAYKESISNAPTNNLDENNWPIYMHDARRSSFAGTSLSRSLKVAWTRDLEGDLTQATIASDKAFIVRKDTYQLVCLNLMDGQIIWTCNFPAALDGPPTILGNLLFIGCRDGSVHCLRASDGEGVWRYLAAPLDRLTLDGGRLASLWPVSSSVMHHMGLIYFAAGRNSYLDGGIRLVALNPADGTVVHQAVLEGPWPDQESLNKGVVRGDAIWRMAPSDKRKSLIEQANNQYATGYHVEGGEADLLVTDGSDIYMAQNKFNPRLEQIDLQREWFTGYTPMGGLHMLANFGLLNDAMFHRVSRMYDDAWPSYGSGPGSAARSGSFVVVGDQRVYAAQHWESGGYASHEPGWGNRIVADNRDTQNLPGDMFGMEDRQKARELKTPTTQKAYVRTDEPLWTVGTPIIVRAMLGALDGQDQELIFAAGIAEGNSVEEWDQSTYYKGSGKLQVFAGDKGELLAEYELPACPVFDGLSAAKGRLIVPMVNGEIICFSASGGKQ